jgi:glycosyltransferase involved in cell wall biosynthesis
MKKLKVVHVCTTNGVGGASIAVHRIHTGLLKEQVDSHVVVGYKKTQDPTIHGPQGYAGKATQYTYVIQDKLYSALNGFPKTVWSSNPINHNIHKTINNLQADVVMLTWIGWGFISPKDIQEIQAPLVWRLSDMWPFTGGCHYAQDCSKYQTQCHNCPQLLLRGEHDISSKQWLEKQAVFQTKPVHIVAISKWIANLARKSALLKENPITIIPNGVDISVWNPLPKDEAKKLFSIESQKKVIGFGAANALKDTRKGFEYIRQAMQDPQLQDVHWLIFGADKTKTEKNRSYFTHADTKVLRQIYSACDVFVVPSIQEAFGQTCIEALSCNTPLVVFEQTGCQDTVEHKYNGYCAKYQDTADVIKGIKYCLAHPHMQQNARKKVEAEFTIQQVAKQYKKLFEQVIKKEQ